jgi:hydrogenase nickel incorporation protein HypA/HybF
MHELAIAESIVRIAGAHADGSRVTSVEVRVGHLRQVVPDALSFAFELVAVGTPVEGATLELEEVAVAGRCRGCGQESELDGFPLRCPACGGLDMEVTRGEELCVEAIEVEREPDVAMTGGERHER